jgi:hypothetical protein
LTNEVTGLQIYCELFSFLKMNVNPSTMPPPKSHAGLILFLVTFIAFGAIMGGIIYWYIYVRKKVVAQLKAITTVQTPGCTYATGTHFGLVPKTNTVPNPGWFYVPNLDPKTGDGYSNSINPGSWIYVVDANNNPVTTGPACVGTPTTVPPAGTLLKYVGP